MRIYLASRRRLIAAGAIVVAGVAVFVPAAVAKADGIHPEPLPKPAATVGTPPAAHSFSLHGRDSDPRRADDVDGVDRSVSDLR